MHLPEAYAEAMQELLQEDYPLYLKSLAEPEIHALRVNTCKISPGEFEKISPFALKKIPWIEGGYYVEKKDKPAKHPYYYAGLYYLQEASAMTPASRLPVQPGDRVLDLCAAPGGKSTQLVQRLHGEGLLIANDISRSRAKALLKNLELTGEAPICVTCEEPEKLADAFPGYFDCILVDAPCSGEGMFHRKPVMTSYWEMRGPAYYSSIQKSLLPSAARMLRPGGYLLYSTCTFNRLEDEESIASLLEQDPSMKLTDMQGYDGFCPGYRTESHPELEKCVRIWPHKMAGEGHFLALLRKEAPAGQAISGEKASVGQAISGSETTVRQAIVGSEANTGQATVGSEANTGQATVGSEASARRTAADSGAPACQTTVGGERISYAFSNQQKGSGLSDWQRAGKAGGLSEEALAFLGEVKLEWDRFTLQIRQDQVFALPAAHAGDFPSGLHYLRQGLYLGQMKKKRFEPSQALAMSLRPAQYPDSISLPADDPAVIRYLKGETIDLPSDAPPASGKTGYVLVCVDRYPLGWAKRNGAHLKNKYNASWRWQ